MSNAETEERDAQRAKIDLAPDECVVSDTDTATPASGKRKRACQKYTQTKNKARTHFPYTDNSFMQHM